MVREVHESKSDFLIERVPVLDQSCLMPVLDSSDFIPELESESVENIETLTTRPQSGWISALLSRLEGPWAPAPEDLPEKRTPEMTGNSPEPFRFPATDSSTAYRHAVLNQVRLSSEREAISRWSTLYSYDVPVRNLSLELTGTNILHLSDVHFLKDDPRPVLELQNLTCALEARKQRVDLLLISGDLLTHGPADLTPAAVQALEALADHASIAAYVPGNHDYHGNGQRILHSAMHNAGIIDVTNNHLRLKISGAPLNVYGVDDAIFGAPLAPRVLNADEFSILLTHNLDAVRGNFADAFDLLLSGHTHWGEIRFFNGSHIMNAWGYCDNKNGHTHAWDMLTDRALSYVHPGLARYYARVPAVWHPPGFVMHTLQPLD